MPRQSREVTDLAGEWWGMPEYRHRDLSGVQKVVVHFKTRADVEAFARLVGQEVTERTRSLWYPERGIRLYGIAK